VLSNASLLWRQAITESGQQVSGMFRDATASRVSYLVPFPAEDDRSFDLRCQLATYVNPVQLIVDAYAQGCTGEVQRNFGSDGLAAQMDDVDLRGNSWGELTEDKARWASVYGILATIIDAPKVNTAKNRAEELAAKIRPYCIVVHPTAWAWVDVDAIGHVTEFAYVDEPYVESVSANSMSRDRDVTVRVYLGACEQHPRGAWQVRKGTITTTGGLEKQRGSFSTIVEEGELPAVLEGEIPVRFLAYQRDTTSRYPLGDSLVEDAAMLARCIYNKRSWEQQIAREAGFPTLAIPMKATGGMLDANTTAAIGPSKGIGYDSSTGAPSWIQPSSEWAKDLRESSMADFQFAMRSAGLELAADASAQAQSGEALRIKSRDYDKRAARFARNLARDELACLRLYALLAGEPIDAITVTYPKRFTLPDLTADLDRALKILAAPFEIGKTARIAAQMQAINASIVLSDEQQTAVREEIEAMLVADAEDFAGQREANAATIAARIAATKAQVSANASIDPRDAETRPIP